jgi:hypothetical protein
MSANTIIVLKKIKNIYQIMFKDIESPKSYCKKAFIPLKKSLEYAKEIQNTNDVEYGIHIENL